MSEPEIRLQPWETLFEEFNAQQYGMSLDTAANTATTPM